MNIYMFHYVNDSNFKYYHFDSQEFEKVILNIKSNGKKIISFSEFKKLVNDPNSDISNCVLFTFDDGTKDHYEIVYPILKKYNVTGLFFLSSNLFEQKILDINLIHKIIASTDFDNLYKEFKKLLLQNNIKDEYEDKIIKTNYDNEKLTYFKQMLQFILPIDIKNKILFQLAKLYNVSTDYRDYYIDISKIYEMKQNGMEFGFHTCNHKRLEKLSYKEQECEIMLSKKILEDNGIIENDAPFSYPFGSYNDDTIEILRQNNIKYAFDIKSIEYKIDNDLLNIPRIDCNVLKEVDYE